jgi:hypothetical protein
LIVLLFSAVFSNELEAGVLLLNRSFLFFLVRGRSSIADLQLVLNILESLRGIVIVVVIFLSGNFIKITLLVSLVSIQGFDSLIFFTLPKSLFSGHEIIRECLLALGL